MNDEKRHDPSEQYRTDRKVETSAQPDEHDAVAQPADPPAVEINVNTTPDANETSGEDSADNATSDSDS